MATESMTQSTLSVERRASMILVLVGVVAWAVATLAFRLVGQYLLNPATEFVMLGVFVAVVPLMAVLMYALYSWQVVRGADRRTAAMLVVLPGMLLDVVSTAFFETIFPNMDPAAAKYFGALLLLAYAVVLLTGVVPQSN